MQSACLKLSTAVALHSPRPLLRVLVRVQEPAFITARAPRVRGGIATKSRASGHPPPAAPAFHHPTLTQSDVRRLATRWLWWPWRRRLHQRIEKSTAATRLAVDVCRRRPQVHVGDPACVAEGTVAQALHEVAPVGQTLHHGVARGALPPAELLRSSGQSDIRGARAKLERLRLELLAREVCVPPHLALHAQQPVAGHTLCAAVAPVVWQLQLRGAVLKRAEERVADKGRRTQVVVFVQRLRRGRQGGYHVIHRVLCDAVPRRARHGDSPLVLHLVLR